jgi:FkbM family methyltransferase
LAHDAVQDLNGRHEAAGDGVRVPPLSYAQNMEDYHLSLAFEGKPRGTYIDIGGGHPIAGSVSFWFYERGWSGVVAEPQKALCELHRQLRPRDSLVPSVIGRQGGDVDFFLVDRLHALSTTVEQHAQTAQAYGASYSAVRLPSLSLAELCKSHGLNEIDFLKIDVEGGERDVLEGGDWQHFRPAIVLVEAISPLINAPAWEAWEPLLLSKGYRFALFDTLNRFYVAEERPDLLSRLPCERAPWDAVRHMYEIGRAPENAGHPDHTLAMQLTRGFLATLPFLSDELVTSFLRRGAGGPEKPTAPPAVNSEAFRFSLGRIACGYDGGQLDDQ